MYYSRVSCTWLQIYTQLWSCCSLYTVRGACSQLKGIAHLASENVPQGMSQKTLRQEYMKETLKNSHSYLGEDQPLNSACKEHLYSSVLSRGTFKKLQLYSSASAGLSQFVFLRSPINKRDWMLKIKRTHSSEPDHGFPLFFVVQNLNFRQPWSHKRWRRLYTLQNWSFKLILIIESVS